MWSQIGPKGFWLAVQCPLATRSRTRSPCSTATNGLVPMSSQCRDCPSIGSASSRIQIPGPMADSCMQPRPWILRHRRANYRQIEEARATLLLVDAFTLLTVADDDGRLESTEKSTPPEPTAVTAAAQISNPVEECSQWSSSFTKARRQNGREGLPAGADLCPSPYELETPYLIT